MSEYVTKEAVLRTLGTHRAVYEDHDETLQARVVAYCMASVRNLEGRRGFWMRVPNTPFMTCSVCEKSSIDEDWLDGKHWEYCPECGAHLTAAEDTFIGI